MQAYSRRPCRWGAPQRSCGRAPGGGRHRPRHGRRPARVPSRGRPGNHAAPAHRPLRRGRVALKRTIAIDEKVHGPDHPGLATSLNKLATLYQATGRHQAAEPLLQRTIAIDEKALGPDIPTSPAGSTTSLCSTGLPTAPPRPSRCLHAPSRSLTKACRRTIRPWRRSARTTPIFSFSSATERKSLRPASAEAGHVWPGAETFPFVVAHERDSWRVLIAHFKPLPLPGGANRPDLRI